MWSGMSSSPRAASRSIRVCSSAETAGRSLRAPSERPRVVIVSLRLHRGLCSEAHLGADLRANARCEGVEEREISAKAKHHREARREREPTATTEREEGRAGYVPCIHILLF